MSKTILPPTPMRPDRAAAGAPGERYVLVAPIAAGGMGEVFRAHDVVLDREVAVKVLHRNLAADPGFVDRFRREARAAAGLNHPNIVAVYDWGETGATYYMVMEHVAGPSLRDLLASSGRLPAGSAADVLAQVLAALDHAHRHGIVHRDLKPENVVLTPEGIAKVADFGLARAYLDPGPSRTAVVGTPQYLAPELIEGEPADPRSDLYALGVVAYELLVGRAPFSGRTPFAVANKHLAEAVPAPSLEPGVDGALDGFVAALTRKEPATRPATAADARGELEVATADLVSPAPSVGDLVRSASGTGSVTPTAVRAATATIPRTTPRAPRRRRAKGRFGRVAIAVLVAAAAAWGLWRFAVPHPTTVPAVIGVRVAQARAELQGDGFHVRMAPGVYSDRFASGRVLAVRPAVGSRVHPGGRVTLTPSLGPEPVRVPSIVGRDLASARRTLSGAGLALGHVDRQWDDRYAAGRVASQGAAIGDMVQSGSAVSVTVSKGPKPFRMPSVVGVGRDTAVAELQALGLRIQVDDTTFLGLFGTTVTGQAPSPGVKVRAGDSVRLVVG